MRIVVTTIGPDAAKDLVRRMVDERLIACGNVCAVQSCYRWQDEICEEPEALIVMETADDRLDAALSRLRELHPYELPKIVVLEPAGVLEAYARWVTESTR